MKNLTPSSVHLMKVSEHLQNLTKLMNEDKIISEAIKEQLFKSQSSQFSDDSLEIYPYSSTISHSKGFYKKAKEEHSQKKQETKNERKEDQLSMQCHSITKKNKFDSEADTTVKKFPPKKQSKGRKQEKLGGMIGKESRLLKNGKNEKKYENKKKLSKYNTSEKKKNLPSNQLKKLKSKSKKKIKKMSLSQQKTNQNLKLPKQLKNEVSSKINHLKVQKQKCQRQSEYLAQSIKINSCLLVKMLQEEVFEETFMVKTLLSFFSQFINESWPLQISVSDIKFILLNYSTKLVKSIVKLPDFLKQKSTLSQQRCSQLFQNIRIIEKMAEGKIEKMNQLFPYLMELNTYISFLLNHNMVRETKRKIIIDSSGRSFLNVSMNSKQKQVKKFDSEREQRKNLKRVKTQKVLSPKQKKGKR